MQSQIDDLLRRVEYNRSGIRALEDRADAAQTRADAAEDRAEAAEARSIVDRDMIAELHAEGVLTKAHAEQMEEALRSSRTIGAAIGIIMENRGVDLDEAYALLKSASQQSNRKLRELATDLVRSPRPRGDVSIS